MWNNLHNAAQSIPIACYTMWELHITCDLCLFALKTLNDHLFHAALRLMHSRGRGVTSVWQTQGKLSHQNAMQFACLLNSVHSRLLLGWHAKYSAVGEKRTWVVVASKCNIVHTQCITQMRPVMVWMKCTFECSFVHAGGRAADTGRLALWNPRLQKTQSISIASLFNSCT